jgi:PAS domain S-box-containing protein
MAMNRSTQRSDGHRARGSAAIGAFVALAIFATGVLASYALSNTLREQAVDAWEAKAEREAQAMTAVMLGWLEESYAPLTALSVLFDQSTSVSEAEFLGAADSLESKSPASFLDSMAVVVVTGEVADSRVALSNDAFGPLPVGLRVAGSPAVMDAAEAAVAQPGRHVLGAPVPTDGGATFLPVAMAADAPSGLVVVLGVLRFDELVSGLFDVYGLRGVGVQVGGRFEGPDGPGARQPLVDIPLDDPRLAVPARSLSASAELFIDWRIGADFEGGVADGTARLALSGGALVAALLALLIGFLMRQNRIVRGRVREATRELAESEAKFRAFYDLNLVGLAATSAEKGWILVNDYLCNLLEYDEQALRKLSWADLTHPDDLPLDEAEFDRMARGEIEQYDIEKRLISRTGREIPAYLSVSCVRKPDRSVDFVVAVVVDITDQKAAEAALRAARDEADIAREAAEAGTRAKSAFLANMSHELRTPMNAIIGYSEMLAEEFEDEGQEDYLSDIAKIRGAGKHLLSLINDILDLSKIEAGRVDLLLERFDLAEMLRETIATARPLMDARGVGFEVALSEDLGAVRADLTKLRQVVLNLLSNAAKFTHEGVVELGAESFERDGDRWIRLAVKDTGIGIEADKLDNVFEEFTQADLSTTREYGGTGLGLAISRRFCRMMGGDITASSVVGEGSTFTIEIPASVDALEAARSSRDTVEDERTTPVPGGSGPLVLIVEDDPDSRDLLARMLSGDGYRVATAADGQQGLALAHELHPDLITLDVMMPGMDGWGMLRRLKADEDICDIPIVMVTIVGDKAMGHALGASDYLQKPVDRRALLQSVRRLTGGRAEDVLIVDDDRDTRDLVRRALEHEGMAVREAADGREALERVAESQPGLVMLDLMMPVMDGFEFLRRLRQSEVGRNVPVIVLTAKVLSDDEICELEAASIEVLSKQAADERTIVDEVRSVLGR